MTEVRYFIVQYIADPFRREQKNVGLIAVSGGRWRAKFFAENPKGGVDKRRAKGLVNHPEVYEQWVEYWRDTLGRRGTAAVDEFLSLSRINFQVIDGGFLEHSTEQLTGVAEQLYSMLVSEDAIGDATAKTKVQRRLKSEFIERAILFRPKKPLTDVFHPVRERPRVVGSRAPHRPSFAQQNDALYVIETLECTTPRTEWRLKERAGYASNMFDDIRGADRNRKVRAIAVVNISPDVRGDKSVRYAERVARTAADEVIDWNDEAQREAFLSARQRIALTKTHTE